MREQRTKKEFTPYNDYVDRGMSLKWGTAFELGELTASIAKGVEQSHRAIPRLPQQTPDQISDYLTQSICHNRLLEIQLNTLDELGRVQPSVYGIFRGFTDIDTLLVDEVTLTYQDIRHIRVVPFSKWFDLDDDDVKEL